MPIAFFALITAIFPLGSDIDLIGLANFAPSIIWMTVLLVSTLTLEQIYKDDYHNGSLEQWVLAPCGLYPIVLAKIFSHWCAMGLPIIVFAPLYAYMLGLPSQAMATLVYTLLLGTPVLALFGSVGAALTVGVRHGGVLLALLMLPLYVPLIVFSANAVDLAASGIAVDPILAILAAILIMSALTVPWLVCAALRIMAG